MENLDKFINEGNTFFDENNFEKAIEIWKDALEYIKLHKKLNSRKSWFNISIGDAYFRKDEYEKALEYFKAGNKTTEKNEKNYCKFRLGQTYFKLGQDKKAIKEFCSVYISEGKKIFEEEEDIYYNFFYENVIAKRSSNKKLNSDYLWSARFGDLEVFKRIYDICDFKATLNGATALATPLGYEQFMFLVENGVNPLEDCGRGLPAMYYQMHSPAILKELQKRGANLNEAMKYAKNQVRLNWICNLLDLGVDLGKYDFSMEYVLSNSSNVDITNILQLTKELMKKNLKISERMQQSITKIGERFEFYRDAFNKDSVDEYSDALDELYKIYGVKPVPRRLKLAIGDVIKVKSTTWQKQHDELWNMLVPGNGQAESVQGELIRIIGKVLYEILDNGGINWDMDFRKMLNSIPKYIEIGSAKNRTEIKRLVGMVNFDTDEKTLEELNRLIVEWVLDNPELMQLNGVGYKR